MKRLFATATALTLVFSGFASMSQASVSPTWVDFDAAVDAPYVGLENQGSAPIYGQDISAMHALGGKYWFFRGPDLFSFDPASQLPPVQVAATPDRSAGNPVTGFKNTTFLHEDLIIYTGLTSGVWAFDTTNNTSYEIKAGSDSLRHIRDFTMFGGTPIFIAQIQGSAIGAGWGIYSVDLSSRSGSPETYAATLRRASSGFVNIYGGGFATYGELAFFSEGQGTDQNSVWVLDKDWDSEPLVDIDGVNNTQAGHMVAFNGKLGFKARTSDGTAEYFIMDISGITPATVDGTPQIIDRTSPLLTRLTLLDSNPLSVSQAAGIGGRYIVMRSINTQVGTAYSYDTVTGNFIRLADSLVNNARIRPFTVSGVEMALLSQGTGIRTYNPANGDFGIQVSDISTLVQNGQVVYDFSLADTSGDGNSDVAAFGVSTFNSPQRWFYAPVSAFRATAAFKTVTFDANGGTGSMETQFGLPNNPLIAGSFTNEELDLISWNEAADGSGASYAPGSAFPFTANVTLFAQWGTAATVGSAPAPYTGPVLSDFSTRTLDPCTATAVTINGSNLFGATATIQGKTVTVLENTSGKLVLAFPAGLAAKQGEDLVVASNSGTLRFQNAFDISSDSCATSVSKGRWTQLQADGQTVKMYAKDPISDGKIQFFVNGKELAWITAADESDPKLSFASGSPYLVRTVTLNPGKNRFEILVDGERVWRATYVPKG